MKVMWWHRAALSLLLLASKGSSQTRDDRAKTTNFRGILNSKVNFFPSVDRRPEFSDESGKAGLRPVYDRTVASRITNIFSRLSAGAGIKFTASYSRPSVTTRTFETSSLVNARKRNRSKSRGKSGSSSSMKASSRKCDNGKHSRKSKKSRKGKGKGSRRGLKGKGKEKKRKKYKNGWSKFPLCDQTTSAPSVTIQTDSPTSAPTLGPSKAVVFETVEPQNIPTALPTTIAPVTETVQPQSTATALPTSVAPINLPTPPVTNPPTLAPSSNTSLSPTVTIDLPTRSPIRQFESASPVVDTNVPTTTPTAKLSTARPTPDSTTANPTMSPTVSPTVSTEIPTFPPTIQPSRSPDAATMFTTVTASPFRLDFRDLTDVSDEDLNAANMLTQQFFDDFLIEQFSFNLLYNFDSSDVDATAVDTQAGSVDWNVDANFSTNTVAVPTQADLDVLIRAAFTSPSVDSLLLALQQIPGFSSINSVSYSAL